MYPGTTAIMAAARSPAPASWEKHWDLGVLLLKGIKTECGNKVFKQISHFPEGWGFEECGGHLQSSDTNGKQLPLLWTAKACGAHPDGPRTLSSLVRW